MQSTQVHAPPRPLVPRSADSVQVLQSLPEEPHVQVALLQVQHSEPLRGAERAALIASLREEAANIGCDAVYVPGSAEGASAAEGAPAARDAELDPLLGSCIVFTPPEPGREGELETADTRKLELAPGAP